MVSESRGHAYAAGFWFVSEALFVFRETNESRMLSLGISYYAKMPNQLIRMQIFDDWGSKEGIPPKGWLKNGVY